MNVCHDWTEAPKWSGEEEESLKGSDSILPEETLPSEYLEPRVRGATMHPCSDNVAGFCNRRTLSAGPTCGPIDVEDLGRVFDDDRDSRVRPKMIFRDRKKKDENHHKTVQEDHRFTADMEIGQSLHQNFVAPSFEGVYYRLEIEPIPRNIMLPNTEMHSQENFQENWNVRQDFYSVQDVPESVSYPDTGQGYFAQEQAAIDTRDFQFADPNEYSTRATLDHSRYEQIHRQSLAYPRLCPSDQWLRCPASSCPLYTTPTDFFAPLPCTADSSDMLFHYDEELGYLTPAEHRQHLEEYLSNEKRKEKSRDAARCRRSRETDIFTELAAALPVSPDQANHLDKASVMRLAIAYLKVRAVVNAIPEPLAKSEPTAEMDEFFLKALDGFMLVLSSNGDMVYMSENVSDYLGVSQMDMMGQSVYEYSHPCDHEELRECLSVKPLENNEKHPCNFFLRLKCTLTSKGRKVNLKSASYKVIHCTGHLMMTRDSNSNKVPSDDEENEDDVERESGACLVVVGCPIPHPSNIEVPLGRHTFLSKHSLNMKFTYADDKLAEYLGWDSSELVGQSIFDFHHALDNPALDKSFKSRKYSGGYMNIQNDALQLKEYQVFSKGQCETVAYRFLGKKGGFAWVVTQATLIHCSKQQKPLSVVCVNYILSAVECEDEVYSARQLEARGSVNLEQPSGLQELPGLVNAASAQLQPVQIPLASIPLPERPRPQAVTASLFHRQKKSSEEEEILLKKEIPAPRPIVTTKKIFAPKPELRKDFEVQPQKDPVPPKPTAHLFQGKPILDYNPELQQRNRPQAVTRSLFAPAPPLDQRSRPPPQTATASIFAPRTKDMNKGFLTFSEDHPGLTMLKDEPEDLTHLAPTPGDVCVPLEDTPFLSDMLDEFILSNENYCPLLSPDLPSELRGSELGDSALKENDLSDSLGNRELGESLADSDPFMYRDSPSPCSTTPNLLSPTLSKSPERSVDSLCSPSGSGSGGGLSEDEMLMLSINDVLADDELALRAPYIPMSDQDEALQLLISDDMVMWGPAQPPDKKSKWVNKEQEPNMSSSLAQLLRTDAESTKKCNDHGGGLVDPTDVLGQIYRKSTNEDSWQIKVERAQKRVHMPSASFENENKRIKCEEKNSSSVQDRMSVTNSELHEETTLSARAGSQLLQQLMSQQIPKSRILLGHRDEGSGSGGGGGTDRTNGTNGGTESPNSRQQSNSVLMNLLVSGCDDIIDPRNIPPLLQQKLSPLTVHLDNQTVPQCPRVVSLDHLSPDTRKQLMNSIPNTKRPESSVPTSMMSFENYDFDPSLLQASDLLRTLDSNLV